jgi:uncharacterized membrane protein
LRLQPRNSIMQNPLIIGLIVFAVILTGALVGYSQKRNRSR